MKECDQEKAVIPKLITVLNVMLDEVEEVTAEC